MTGEIEQIEQLRQDALQVLQRCLGSEDQGIALKAATFVIEKLKPAPRLPKTPEAEMENKLRLIRQYAAEHGYSGNPLTTGAG